MNELTPINETEYALACAEIHEEMVDWHIANMPLNTVRVYDNAVNKHRAEATNV